LVLSLKIRDHSGNRGVYVDNIKVDIMETGLEEVDLICVTQDRDQWRILVDTVMKLLVP
jgi:hypothetical protein